MTSLELQLIMHYLGDTTSFFYPYNYGHFRNAGTDEESWNAYQWNPPEYSRYIASDPSASAKPTWQQITDSLVSVQLIEIRTHQLSEIRGECRGRICDNYGETSIENEILKRLRNGHTAAQDTERDRLRAKYTTIKSTIEAANYSTLLVFDASVDSLWSA